ncbi:hypothetical protein [Bradyrhizobium sp. JYMT SZCCT0428]|uniref:hypothetical protein n=1 Tax=Bradyrhizobium sp. JYMT SZCCT0428 TaxID=2807673 RepID=UPI001BAA948E|nr:hypothetical protein [Bradyrhizobium sp. JYMT SZCCT0428]MBR1157378.1 hypothetical protein [Bradyrhizobium sp. JYMT SZCCT0428]
MTDNSNYPISMEEILRRVREQYADEETKDKAFCTDQAFPIVEEEYPYGLCEVIEKLRKKSLN